MDCASRDFPAGTSSPNQRPSRDPQPKDRLSTEIDRLSTEKLLWGEGFERVMGLDEVGRGCLSGPVVAAGVVFSPGTNPIKGLRDSKKMTREQREDCSLEIKEKALFWTIQHATREEIDQINILRASLLAMQRCVEALNPAPDMLLVDGNQTIPVLIAQQTMVKGDDRSATIAAAAVLAKVFRDAWMERLHQKFPAYGWNRNAGYPTREHREAIRIHGVTPHHRQSFKLL